MKTPLRKSEKSANDLRKVSKVGFFHSYKKVCVGTVATWSLLLMWLNAVKDSVVMIS